MNIDDAIHAITSDYPGGAEALAVRMNEKPAVFRSKANPNYPSHYFRPQQLVEMQVKTGRKDILYAMAAELDCVVLERSLHAPENVLAAITKLSKEFSDVLREATEGVSDGNFSPNDRKRVQAELVELIDCANALIPALETVNS